MSGRDRLRVDKRLNRQGLCAMGGPYWKKFRADYSVVGTLASRLGSSEGVDGVVCPDMSMAIRAVLERPYKREPVCNYLRTCTVLNPKSTHIMSRFLAKMDPGSKSVMKDMVLCFMFAAWRLKAFEPVSMQSVRETMAPLFKTCLYGSWTGGKHDVKSLFSEFEGPLALLYGAAHVQAIAAQARLESPDLFTCEDAVQSISVCVELGVRILAVPRMKVVSEVLRRITTVQSAVQ